MKLGAVIALLNELVLLGVKILALYREAKRKEWIKEGQLIGDALKNAKTDDARADLARRLFEHRRMQ